MYIYTCKYICMCVYICIYISLYVYIYIYIIYVYICTCICIYMYIYTYTSISPVMQAYHSITPVPGIVMAGPRINMLKVFFHLPNATTSYIYIYLNTKEVVIINLRNIFHLFLQIINANSTLYILMYKLICLLDKKFCSYSSLNQHVWVILYGFLALLVYFPCR